MKEICGMALDIKESPTLSVAVGIIPMGFRKCLTEFCVIIF